MPRPSEFSEELAAEIAARITEGRSLKEVAEDKDLPSLRTIHRWIGLHTEFSRMVDHAQQARIHDEVMAVFAISDEPVADNAQASRQRNRIDARLRAAAMLVPQKYAARLAVGAAPELPVLNEDKSKVELARELAFLLRMGAEANTAPPPPPAPLQLVHVERSAEEKNREAARTVAPLTEDEMRELYKQQRNQRPEYHGSPAEQGLQSSTLPNVFTTRAPLTKR
jgi:hypothetical protein